MTASEGTRRAGDQHRNAEREPDRPWQTENKRIQARQAAQDQADRAHHEALEGHYVRQPEQELEAGG